MRSIRAFLYRLVFIANKALFPPLCAILTYYETGDKADPQQAENNFNHMTDPNKMEACIYEMNSLKARYNCAVIEMKHAASPPPQ